MDQATLDNDDLFGEAASELREDIEAALDEAEAALPPADAVWQPEGDNLLGQLNTLRGTLDTDSAVESLREARKWLEVAERSGAIDGEDDLADRADAVASKLEAVEEARDAAGSLTATLPALREALQDD